MSTPVNEIKGSGIKSVSFYTASPVETCDRCSQGIKHVALVRYADGVTARYGMDCINQVLSSDNSLKKVFASNARLLKVRQAALDILNLPESEMPIDECGYFNRGIYFIAGHDGKAISGKSCSFFHPTKIDPENVITSTREGFSDTLDMRGCPGKGAYEPKTAENWAIKCRQSIEEGKEFLRTDIARIESFLARVLSRAAK